MKAPYGWTIVRRGGFEPWHVYRRDCPATGSAADLANDTFPTKEEAEKEAERRNKSL